MTAAEFTARVKSTGLKLRKVAEVCGRSEFTIYRLASSLAGSCALLNPARLLIKGVLGIVGDGIGESPDFFKTSALKFQVAESIFSEKYFKGDFIKC